MYQALYRKWRPRTFDDVYGQEHITSVLKYETENNKFSHAYLFCGSRGTGKTTCAKILAKAVNCESPVNGSPCNKCASCMSIDAGIATDVLEMDAASNNGVDNIRDIRDEVVYMPSELKYRVYIVDEVHMLSGSAFNALLKTLEEPPSHVVFVLATTELHKLPSTIISRCQRFDFRRISTDVLVSRLALISDAEGISYDKSALRLIAKQAQGGMRDAISLFELCAGAKKSITDETVFETVGSGGRENIENTIRAIAASDHDALFGAVDSVVSSSKDIAVFWQELLSYYRDMLVMKTTDKADKYLDLTDHEAEQLREITGLFSREAILAHCKILDESLYSMQKSVSSKRIVAEMALIKMCDPLLDSSTEALLARIAKLENMLAGGSFTPFVNVNDDTAGAANNVPSRTNDKADHGVDAKESDSYIPSASDISAAEQRSSEANKSADFNSMGNDKTFKAIRGWNEICENASSGDHSVLPFLKMAKAFTDAEGRVYVRFPNDFAMTMALKGNVKNDIRASLNRIMQRSITDEDILYGKLEGTEEITDLDDLMV